MNIRFGRIFDWLREVITVHRERREVNLLTTEGDLLQGGGEEVDQSIFFTRYLHQFHCVTTFLAFFALKIRCEETRPLICGIYLVDVVSRFFKLFLISLAFSFPSLISLFIASSSCNWGRFRRLRLLLMKLHLICFQTAVRLMIKR